MFGYFFLSSVPGRRGRGDEGCGNEKVRGGGTKGVGGGRGLFDQPLGHVFVGDLDLLVAGAGVGELFPAVGVVQVLPHHRHLFGDVEASVLLGHHLGKNYPTSASFKRSAKKTNKTGSQCSVRLQLGGFRGDTAGGGEPGSANLP